MSRSCRRVVLISGQGRGPSLSRTAVTGRPAGHAVSPPPSARRGQRGCPIPRLGKRRHCSPSDCACLCICGARQQSPHERRCGKSFGRARVHSTPPCLQAARTKKKLKKNPTVSCHFTQRNGLSVEEPLSLLVILQAHMNPGLDLTRRCAWQSCT